MSLVPPSSHTTGGIPGWTDDGFGNVTANGSLTFTDGTSQTIHSVSGLNVSGADSEEYDIGIGEGIVSIPLSGTTAFAVMTEGGATVGVDAGGLTVIGFGGLPTSDPHSAGALYTTAGAVFVSAG